MDGEGDTAGEFIARQTESSGARLGDVLGDLSAKLGVQSSSEEAEVDAEEAPVAEAATEDAEAASEE